jgi:flagellar basal-body rod protein FlgB
MDYADISLFSTMKAKMNYMSQRQGVLAENIANADTPNYLAQDVKEPDFAQMVAGAGKLRMAITNAKHIAAGSESGGRFEVQKRDSTYELNPDGNNVSIEEEMSKIAENQAEYNKVTNLYRKTVDMFKTAIGRPSGS